MLRLLMLILTSIYSISTAPVNNEQNSPIVDAKTLNYLLDKGYMGIFKPAFGELQTQRNIASALRSFQKFANIPETGKLDDLTKEYINKPRCGMPDITNKKKRTKRYTLQGSKWKFNTLTWALENSNNDGISDGQVRNIMYRSFAKWGAVTNLVFNEINGQPVNRANIRVRFERGSHGDPYAFDGRSGTLAHAFYPLDNNGLAGDIHFDDDEVYTVGSEKNKKKLLWVAVHELGHSIGLEHSALKGAVMYPWYQHFDGNDFDLTSDDILGIQLLYGSKVIPTKLTTTKANAVSTKVPTIPQQCIDYIGAVLLGRDERTYIFNKDKLYVLKKATMEVLRGPIPVDTYFASLKTVDAVFRRPADGMIVFFHGDEFSVYNSRSQLSKPRKISDGFQRLERGFRDVDASFVWSKFSKLYIFKGENYWRFSLLGSLDYTLDYGYPQKIALMWQGLPKSIDAVFEWGNKQTYFFQDKEYYRWDSKNFEVYRGYPQKIYNNFISCPSAVGDDLTAKSGDRNISNTLFTTILILIISYLIT